MAEYEEEIPDEEKVTIASDFIVNSPPGEFNEVFNDVRVLLGNDQLLKDGASSAFEEYNETQFTPAKIEGSSEVLVTKHGKLDDGKYLDPRSKQSFKFDHLRKAVSDIEAAEVDECGGFRAPFEKAVTEYTNDHYDKGTSTVYGKGDEVICCIEHHKFQPNNFWNGRWRSQWSLNTKTGEGSGVLRLQVHYYEDGNVQLTSSKTVPVKIAVDDPESAASKFVELVEKEENEYQTAISSNYVVMSDTTFKALRRALPITRSKVNWHRTIQQHGLAKDLTKGK